MKKIVIAGTIFFTLAIKIDSIFASELMSTADAFGTNGWQVSVYGQDVKREPIIERDQSGSIQIGNASVFTNSSAEVEMEEHFQATIAAFTYRHRDGLHYR